MFDPFANDQQLAIMVLSVTRALRKIQFNTERQQPIEQRRLAIIMPRLEAAVAGLFAAVLEQTKPQQGPQDSAPPWRRPTCPMSPTEWQAPGWYTAASASRRFANRLQKPIATTAQCRCPPAAKSRASRDRNTRDPCAKMRDETGSPVIPTRRLGDLRGIPEIGGGVIQDGKRRVVCHGPSSAG